MTLDPVDQKKVQACKSAINRAIVALYHKTEPGRPPSVSPALQGIEKALEQAWRQASALEEKPFKPCPECSYYDGSCPVCGQTIPESFGAEGGAR